MPRLIFSIDLTASPLELAAQALTVARMREFAQRTGLKVQERENIYRREFDLLIPAERLNDTLYELDRQSLLHPTQEITGSPDLHVKLEERFSTLTWVVAEITVRHLLHHGGGWDRSATFDPVFTPWLRQAAQAVRAPEPATCETVIRFMLGRPLEFPPGTRYAYSNLGYCVLGRIIEKVTGQRYEEYVRTSVLAPAGISGLLGRAAKLEERASGEVRYYIYPGGPQAGPSIFPGRGRSRFPMVSSSPSRGLTPSEDGLVPRST